jgi:excisionase family DNA binding protein
MASPLLYTIPDACEALGIGRSHLYELMDSGELYSVKLGKRRLIPQWALETFVEGLPAAADVRAA